MLFNSLAFPIFLLVVLLIHWWLPSRRARNAFLLTASYFFYACWDWRFLFLIVLSTGVDYFCGLFMDRAGSERARRGLLIISLLTNLGILGTFKYFAFFGDNLVAILDQLNYQPSWTFLNLILPLGISFYTFQSLSYTIDVYRRRCAPCRDAVTFFLFVSYFPQLVAGPIEKAIHLIPQLERNRSFDVDFALKGLRYILWGFFLKSVVADNLAPFVNETYGNLATQSAGKLLLATYGFAFQIYGDFAGYSSIAIGTSALFGIRLSTNFSSPYLSHSVREFWTRWHITLTSWFREYVYIFALGGNRHSETRRRFNVLLTFAASGLWHGANWTFVIWGLLNGLFYFVEKPFRSPRPIARLLNVVVAFHLISFGWIFFRAPTLGDAFYILRRMTEGLAAWLPTDLTLQPLWLALLILTVVGVEYVQRHRETVIDIDHLSFFTRRTVYSVFIVLFFFVGLFHRTPFIYFQF